MQPAKTMTVSQLKNQLLEVVRRVERGDSVEITKDGRPVAVLVPREAWGLKATGFARVEVRGDLELPAVGWSYDTENLKAGKRSRRR